MVISTVVHRFYIFGYLSVIFLLDAQLLSNLTGYAHREWFARVINRGQSYLNELCDFYSDDDPAVRSRGRIS